MGYYLPWAAAGAALTAIGNGVSSLLSPTTSTGQWVGYQILIGAGRGCIMQSVRSSISIPLFFLSSSLFSLFLSLFSFSLSPSLLTLPSPLPLSPSINELEQPYLAVQNTLPPSQISPAISLLSFCQSLGGAVFLTIGNTIFANQLRRSLATDAPHADADAVIAAGATAFRRVVDPADLPGVLLAFTKGIDAVMYMTAAFAVACFAAAWGMGWVDIRRKKPIAPEA